MEDRKEEVLEFLRVISDYNRKNPVYDYSAVECAISDAYMAGATPEEVFDALK